MFPVDEGRDDWRSMLAVSWAAENNRFYKLGINYGVIA
jgi:hypothetical protein